MDIRELKEYFFLDTSLPLFSASYYDGSQLNQIIQPINKSHSMGLEDRISDFLSQYDKELSEIDALVYHPGPGSFTGMRIGAAFLAGVASVSGASLFALNMVKGIKKIIAGDDSIYLRNAKKREFYALKTGFNDFELIKLSQVRKCIENGTKAFYEGTFDYPEDDFTSAEITPSDYHEAGCDIEKVEKGRVIFYYINDPDIRR